MERDKNVNDFERIQKMLPGYHIIWFDETDSTNLQAKAYARQGGGHKTLFAADCQSSAKGRRGRSWEAPAGCNIYMSLLLRPEISTAAAPMLTLVMAVSVAEAIQKMTNAEPRIKWPNDIVLNKKKLCGILTEMNVADGKIQDVVIGVGVNVNQTHFAEELAEKATSIKIETGHSTDRMELIRNILEAFENYYEIFQKTEDLSGILDQYHHLLVNKNCEVKVHDPQGAYHAYALGINEKGELLVRMEDETVKQIYAGEVSVRGLYGYV